MLREISSEKPAIVITMGDPAGIGPEIVVKALANEELFNWCRPVIAGNHYILEKAASVCGAAPAWDKFDLIDIQTGSVESGKLSSQAGQAAYDYIKEAVDLCLSGGAAALVTAPVNKEALKLARVDFIGHTEILAGLTGSYDPLTMFYVHGLKIFFLTRHIAFSDICGACTKERIYEYIIRCTEILAKTRSDSSSFDSSGKPFAVAALNPHGGDNGLFGEEEEREILPAVLKARQEGINVEGPVPADSVFHMARKGKYSGVLSLYHDQGHIAAKTLDFEKTVAVTYGLPFLRTSVDHGTAFDIAGSGKASEVSLVEAVRVAAHMTDKK